MANGGYPEAEKDNAEMLRLKLMEGVRPNWTMEIYFKRIFEMFKNSCGAENEAEVKRTLAINMKCSKCEVHRPRYTFSIPNDPKYNINKIVKSFNAGKLFKACCDNAEIHFELPELLVVEVNNNSSPSGTLNIPILSPTFKLQTPVGWKTSAPDETTYELVSCLVDFVDGADICAYVVTDIVTPTNGNWYKFSKGGFAAVGHNPDKGCAFIYQKKPVNA